MTTLDLSLATEVSGTGVWNWDVESDINVINRAWASMIGFELDELSPLTSGGFFALVHPDDQPSIQAELEKHFQAPDYMFRVTFRMKHKAGHWVWIQARGEVTHWQDERPARMMGVHIDISNVMEKVALHQGANEAIDEVLSYSPAIIYTLSSSYPHAPTFISGNFRDVINKAPDLSRPGLLFGTTDSDHHLDKDFTDWVNSPSMEPLSRLLQVADDEGSLHWIRDVCHKVMRKGQLHSLSGVVIDKTRLVEQEALLNEVAEVIPGMIYQYVERADGSRSFPYSSAKIKDIYGVSSSTARDDANSVFAVIHPEDIDAVSESIRLSRETLTQWSAQYRVTGEGKERWLHGTSIPQRNSQGDTVWSGLLMDITAQKETEKQLMRANKYLELAHKIAQTGHWEANLDTGELVWSDLIFDIFGLDKTKDAPSIELFNRHLHPDDIGLVRASEQRAKVTGIHDVVHRIIRPSGEVRWVHELADYESLKGQSILFGTVRDITETKVLEIQLREKSSRDHLTGLYNRRHFMEEGEMAMQRARRGDRPLSLLSFDIDFFKRVNDRFGHAMGDQVLVEVSRCCADSLRSTDLLARIGGEEFSIILEGCTQQCAVVVAEKLRDAVGKLRFDTGQLAFSVTISIGVTQMMEKTLDLGALLKESDKALYFAKREGRDRVATADQAGASLSDAM